mmetsp:Transcript_6563/g.17105  ORF Transcript_6563/g.17105 Transcript_6563/m.17105 type:complete len:200 (+) Transcript_6563:113-712(+)
MALFSGSCCSFAKGGVPSSLSRPCTVINVVVPFGKRAQSRNIQRRRVSSRGVLLIRNAVDGNASSLNTGNPGGGGGNNPGPVDVDAWANPSLPRLAQVAVSAPQRVRRYFEEKPSRKLVWTGIALFFGFYGAGACTLAFGALAINDNVAGVVLVLFHELVSRAWWSRPKKDRGLGLRFAQAFKCGMVLALIADSFKLGS